MKGKNPMEIKDCMVINWQRALITPFRKAPALEVDPLQLVTTLFTGKRTT